MIECMNAHPDDQFIQASGCSMLLSLATTRKIRALLVDVGAPSAIIRAMTEHSHSSLSKTIAEFGALLLKRFYRDRVFDDHLNRLGASNFINRR